MLLKPEPLLPESFAPFGTVIETEDAERCSLGDGHATLYHRLARIDPGEGASAIVSIIRARRWPNRMLERLERHPKSTRTLIPMTTEDWVLVVAHGERPKAEDCRLFHAFGDQGVQYDPGIWHHPLLILTQSQEFLLIERDGAPCEGLEEITLDPPASLPWP